VVSCLVHPAQDVASARVNCELELGGGPAELAITACRCLDFDPKVDAVVIDGLDVVVSPGVRIGSPDDARGVQSKLLHSLALDAQDDLLAAPADCAVVLGLLVAARRPGAVPAPAARPWSSALRRVCAAARRAWTNPRSGRGGRGARSGDAAGFCCGLVAAGRGDSAGRTISLLMTSASDAVSSSSASTVSSACRARSGCQAILRRASTRCICRPDRQRKSRGHRRALASSDRSGRRPLQQPTGTSHGCSGPDRGRSDHRACHSRQPR
jgi:hypothetical protein